MFEIFVHGLIGCSGRSESELAVNVNALQAVTAVEVVQDLKDIFYRSDEYTYMYSIVFNYIIIIWMTTFCIVCQRNRL